MEFLSRPADPVYEKPGDDVYIQGAWKNAGDRLYVGQVSREHGHGTFTTGCRPGFAFSKDYAYMPDGYPIFKDDFTHRQGELTVDVSRGNTETDPQTLKTRGYQVGENLFETLLETSSIPVVQTINELLIEVEILGKTLLRVPSPRRELLLEELQKRLRHKYVGLEPKVLSQLTLRIDTTSEQGQQALKDGGLEIVVEYRVKTYTHSVHFTLTPDSGSQTTPQVPVPSV